MYAHEGTFKDTPFRIYNHTLMVTTVITTLS